MTDTVVDAYVRRFRPGRVVDGDTLIAELVDLGYNTAATPGIRYRLLRINCPESNRPASRTAGLAATRFTTTWITAHLHGGAWLWARSEQTDSFGRYLAEVTCAEGHNLSDALLSSGHAVAFE